MKDPDNLKYSKDTIKNSCLFISIEHARDKKIENNKMILSIIHHLMLYNIYLITVVIVALFWTQNFALYLRNQKELIGE